MIPRFMAQFRDFSHHTRIPQPGLHPEIIEPRHPEIMFQLCHFQGIGWQFVDVVAKDHGFGGPDAGGIAERSGRCSGLSFFRSSRDPVRMSLRTWPLLIENLML